MNSCDGVLRGAGLDVDRRRRHLPRGGIQLIVLGVMGTYIADIHAEVKGRPLYVVGELENFDGVPALPPRAVVRSSRGRAPRFRRPKRMSRTDPHEGRAAAGAQSVRARVPAA